MYSGTSDDEDDQHEIAMAATDKLTSV